MLVRIVTERVIEDADLETYIEFFKSVSGIQIDGKELLRTKKAIMSTESATTTIELFTLN